MNKVFTFGGVLALAFVLSWFTPVKLPPAAAGNLIDWSELGPKLLATGVISQELYDSSELNRLWALGLANKNPILDTGEMVDPSYGGAERFASTGGWTPAIGSAMDHYSKHTLITLTPSQQTLVERVSQNIYRPCCDNSTHFPDCNHGMAMLGLLEHLASRGAGEQEMYRVALEANSRWFPEHYLNIAKFTSDPQAALGKTYSSGSGYRQNVLAKLQPQSGGGGVSCSV